MMPKNFQNGKSCPGGRLQVGNDQLGWGARIAFAFLLALFLAVFAYGCASALDYDDYSADYWDPTGHYRQIDEERRLDREAQERDWMRRDGICGGENF